jgi:hypothetical protein
MINLSVDTQNLSSTSKQEVLEEVLSEMINLVESEFEINVEEIDGDNSYWVPTPDDEVEELELFGIIELGDDQPVFQKITALTHEVGHCIYHKQRTFRTLECTLFSESLAWYLGYHFMEANGYFIDIDDYNKEIEYAIDLYRRSENARDDE